MDLKETYALHSAQQEALQAEVDASQPLLSEYEAGFNTLRAQYQSASAGFLQGLERLEERRYTGMRRVRGDGNCFFRGFMFRLVEQLVAQVSLRSKRVESTDTVCSSGMKRNVLGSLNL